MLIIFITFFYIFHQLHERNLLQEQQRILALQSKAQWGMFEYQKQASDMTNRKWHDFRFHSNNLIELLEEGKIDMALTYLKEQQILDIPENVEYCKHSSVNSILLFWAGRVQKAGISINIKTEIPQILNIDPMELSALFANALENAYDGCECLPENCAKYISIEADYKGERLTVMITNSCQNDIFFHDDLPVSQREGGGNGIRSMQYIAKRHKGTAFFNASDNQFTFRTVLYI
jgi:sensor histidine kinase regulating citrate/malate metabolism